MAAQYDSLPSDPPEVVAEQKEQEQHRLRRLQHDADAVARAEKSAQERADVQVSDSPKRPFDCFNECLSNKFKEHAEQLRKRSRARRQAVQLKSAVLDREERKELSTEDLLGRRQPQDEFQGDVNIRTLRQLLKMVDDRGFERYAASRPNSFPIAALSIQLVETKASTY